MNYNNYQYNRTNTSYRGAFWANQNSNYGQGASPANRRMNNQYNSSNWRHQPKRLNNKVPQKRPGLQSVPNNKPKNENSGGVGSTPKPKIQQSVPNNKPQNKNSGGVGSTPKPKIQPAEQKEQEKEAVGTFMMVVATQYPVEVLTDEQLDNLQSEILSAIDKIEDETFRPQFLECFKKKGALVIDCHNEQSIEWLKKCAQTLVPWEGAHLRVIQPGKALVQMFVVHNQYPWEILNSDQMDSLKANIMTVVKEIPKDDFTPQFLNCYAEKGALVVECNDQESADWLKKEVPSMLSWDGPEIFVTDPENVPSLRYLRLSIPDPFEDPELILQRLQRQNEAIDVKDWHFVRTKKEKDCTKIFVAVKDEVVKFLKQTNFTLFLNFGKINLRDTGKFRPILVKDQKPNGADESVQQELENSKHNDQQELENSKHNDSAGDSTLTELDQIMPEVANQDEVEQ